MGAPTAGSARDGLAIAVAIAIAAVSAGGCFDLGAYACAGESAACRLDDRSGVCEPSGYCSYPDADCPAPSRRYGPHAGDGLAGTCVPADAGTTTNAATLGVDSLGVDSTSSETSAPTVTGDEPSTGTTAGTTTGTMPSCVRTATPCIYDEPPGADQRAHGIAMAPDGGWAVAGSLAVDPEFADHDALVLRFDGDGDVVWSVQPVATAGSEDIARSVVVSDDDRVVAVGMRGQGIAGWIATLAPDGSEEAYFELAAAAGAPNDVWDVVLDGDELLLVATVGDGVDSSDALVGRYSIDGGELWSDVIASPLADDGRGLALGPAGVLYVIGNNGDSPVIDWWYRRYHVQEELDWELDWELTHSLGDFDVGRRVAVGAIDTPAFIGSSNGGLYVMRRDASGIGEPLWARFYETTDDGTHGGLDVTIDAAGNVIAAGWFSVEGQGEDAFVRKYTPDGMTLWTEPAQPLGDGNDRATGVVTDAAGRVVVAGYLTNAAGDADAFVLVLPP